MDIGITKLYVQHKSAAEDLISSVFLTGRSMV